ARGHRHGALQRGGRARRERALRPRRGWPAGGHGDHRWARRGRSNPGPGDRLRARDPAPAAAGPMSDRFLAGRAAWVTGGATGMGRATALALAKAGADVAIGSLTAAVHGERVARETTMDVADETFAATTAA